jgi:hypothetical protein
VLRSLGLVIVAGLLASLLASCGFVKTGESRSKPSGFPLRGYVSVLGASPGGLGTPCQAPTSASDVSAGVRVQVLDPAGDVLGTSSLGRGVLAEAPDRTGYRCNFPFEVVDVPGGPDEYTVVVGTRPAVTFPAMELRANKPAIIELR